MIHVQAFMSSGWRVPYSVFILCPGKVGYCNRLVRPSVRPSVCPSLFCPDHNFKTMQGINMKLHRQIDLIEKCSAQKHNSRPHTFRVSALCCPYLNLVRRLFYNTCNLFWTITSAFFKFGVKAPSKALVTFCDKALGVLCKGFCISG